MRTNQLLGRTAVLALTALGLAGCASTGRSGMAADTTPTAYGRAVAAGPVAEPMAGGLAANPSAIQVPAGYKVEVLVQGLNYPTDITFGRDGAIYVAETGGHSYGTMPDQAPPARILQVLPGNRTRVVYDRQVPMDAMRSARFGQAMAEAGIVPPLIGVTFNPRDGLLYVASRQRYATLNPQTGEWRTIVDGLPSWGEFFNSKPVFDRDGKMWFVLSSQGNSGTIEEHFVKLVKTFNKPDAREVPCEDVQVTGTDYFLKADLPEYFPGQQQVRAEVYAPLGEDTQPGQTIKGQFWCNGAVYRVNADGSQPERMAWGLRSVFGLNFSDAGRLIMTQNSGNIMNPRPLYNDWETILAYKPGAWYGWPDYYSGLPITDPRFAKPDEPGADKDRVDHHFALTQATRDRLTQGGKPEQPLVRIEPHAATQGFVFGRRDWGFDPESDLLVAEWGAIIPYYKQPGNWPGFRVSHVDLRTGRSEPFLINRCGKPGWAPGCEGGLRRPIMVNYGPDGAMYVVDFGQVEFSEKGMDARPGTGVVWKITKVG